MIQRQECSMLRTKLDLSRYFTLTLGNFKQSNGKA